MNIQYYKPHHIIKNSFLFDCNKTFETFKNWLSGEFDLELQIEEEDLKIYFPYGSLKISSIRQGDFIKCNVIVKNLNLTNAISGMKSIEQIEQLVSGFAIAKT